MAIDMQERSAIRANQDGVRRPDLVEQRCRCGHFPPLLRKTLAGGAAFSAPLPLVGRGRGWGSGNEAPTCHCLPTPYPDPPPQGGEGEAAVPTPFSSPSPASALT